MNPADAKLKCSQCGAEISNLTLSPGRGHWLWMLIFIPLMPGLMFLMEWYLKGNNLDYANEIEASLVAVNPAADHVNVLGLVKNTGKHTWLHLTVEAEFFDADGKFLDEATTWRAPAVLSPGSEDHFKLTLMTTDERVLKGNPKVVVKVTNADLCAVLIGFLGDIMFNTSLRNLRAALDPEFAALPRRAILKAAIAGAGGLLSLDVARGATRQKVGKRVVVVGAGFAGLACADELATAGYDVTVVEARDRVGGRVQTLRDLVKGKTVEAGGELVGPNQPTWMAYAKRFGLKFVDLPWDPCDVIMLDGKMLPPERARELWHGMRDVLARLNQSAAPIDADRPWINKGAVELDRQSLDDWIRRQDASDEVKRLIAIQWTGINGLEPEFQSLLAILAIVKGGGLQKFWDETDSTHCVGGTQQLAVLLAKSFVERRGEKQLRLGAPVEAIRIRDDGLTVELVGGEKLTADDVVLTVPPSTWKQITIEPALPRVLRVPMANSTKFLAVVRERVWKQLDREPNAMSTGPVQLTWETTAGQGDDGEHALVAYAGGRTADQNRGWPVDERESRYRAALEALYPGFAKAMTGGRFVDWIADPWARGTYSLPAPGDVTTVGPLLAAPHAGRLHFAGEHCSYAFVGWMEGALQSGVKVARRLAERDGAVAPK